MADSTAEHRDNSVSRRSIANRIRRARLATGWDKQQLAAKSGVSRTTLHHLENGDTRSPRYATLAAMARALGIAVEELTTAESDRSFAPIPMVSQSFNRDTNPVATDVCDDDPAICSGWSPQDWDELYSTFGTGGQLTTTGVVTTAKQINEKRETIQRLHVLLDTHYRQVVSGMIDELCGMVCPEGSFGGDFGSMGPPLLHPASDSFTEFAPQ